MEKNPYENVGNASSDVKFSRSGMKPRLVKFRSDHDENSLYDPQAQYDEIASRYAVDLTVSKSSHEHDHDHDHDHGHAANNNISFNEDNLPTIGKFKKRDFSNVSIEMEMSEKGDKGDKGLSEQRKTFNIDKEF